MHSFVMTKSGPASVPGFVTRNFVRAKFRPTFAGIGCRRMSCDSFYGENFSVAVQAATATPTMGATAIPPYLGVCPDRIA